METESALSLETKLESLQKHLQHEIAVAALDMGITKDELSDEDLETARLGSTLAEPSWVPAKLGHRAADYSGRAKESSPKTQDRREAGARSLVFRAAYYLKAAPALAAECLQYGRDVWDGKYEWNENDVPQLPVAAPRAAEGVAEAEKRRAA